MGWLASMRWQAIKSFNILVYRPLPRYWRLCQRVDIAGLRLRKSSVPIGCPSIERPCFKWTASGSRILTRRDEIHLTSIASHEHLILQDVHPDLERRWSNTCSTSSTKLPAPTQTAQLPRQGQASTYLQLIRCWSPDKQPVRATAMNIYCCASPHAENSAVPHKLFQPLFFSRQPTPQAANPLTILVLP